MLPSNRLRRRRRLCRRRWRCYVVVVVAVVVVVVIAVTVAVAVVGVCCLLFAVCRCRCRCLSPPQKLVFVALIRCEYVRVLDGARGGRFMAKCSRCLRYAVEVERNGAFC